MTFLDNQTFPSLKTSALFLLPSIFFLWVILSWVFNTWGPKAPGPFLAPFSKFWYAWNVWKGDFEVTNIELHRKYGKIVRVGPNDYSIDDPAAVKTIYGIGNSYIKSDWYDGWADPGEPLSNLFSIRRTDLHAMMKRKMGNVFSMSTLVTYEPFVNDAIELFCQKLVEKEKAGEPLDIAELFGHYALDVIGEITFSKRFGFLDSAPGLDKVADSIEATGLVATFAGIFIRWSYLPLLFYLIPVDSHLYTFSLDVIYKGIRGYEARGGKPDPDRTPDMLTKLLDATAKDTNRAEAETIVVGQAAGNIFAGGDTTSISLTSVFFQLMKHPDKLQKLRQELDAADVGEVYTFADSQKLPYLQAVIKEGLRIHPATGLPLWRQVPKEGAVICDQHFPGGVNVGINSWVAHSNEDVFPNAGAFLPERWIENSPETLSKMERYFMTFGMGSRTCLGKNISMLEMNMVLPQMLRSFDFELVDPKKERLDSANRWFVKQRNLSVRVRKRKY